MNVSQEQINKIAKMAQDTALMLSAVAAMRVLKDKHGWTQEQLDEFAKDHSGMIDIVHREQQANRDAAKNREQRRKG